MDCETLYCLQNQCAESAFVANMIQVSFFPLLLMHQTVVFAADLESVQLYQHFTIWAVK